MFKQLQIRKLWVLCSFGIFLTVGLDPNAVAEEFDSDAYGDHPGNSLTPLETVIQGKISFEPRYTKVFGSAEADQIGFPNSEIYWSLVVKSENIRYVLNKRLNPGNPVAPDSVDLDGVLLKSGASVEVEGRVITGIPNYYLLLDIHRVTVLSDSV
jgi:hypothetical protein